MRVTAPTWFAAGCAVAAAASAVLGIAGIVDAQARVTTRSITVDGVPMLEVSDRRDLSARPGVVVAHGFAGSGRLMQGFADTLAARGYVVVLPDLTGHGANPSRLGTTVGGGRADVLQDDLATAVRHLRSSSAVDPDRIALVGHSMGAGAVTQYAAEHPDIRATVAISLGSVDGMPRDAARPRNLLLLVGAAEFARFQSAAKAALALGYPAAAFGVTAGDPVAGTARRAVTIAGTDHVAVLFATRTHEELARWLDASLGVSTGSAETHPRTRLVSAALLLLAFVVGLVPLARLLSRSDLSTLDRTVSAPMRTSRTLVGLAVGLTLAIALAGAAPTNALPLAVGGYAAGFFAIIGIALIAAWAIERRATLRSAWPRPPTGKQLLIVLALAAYAVTAIALPTHLGMFNALPVGARWWLLAVVAVCVGLLLLGAELVAGRSWWPQPIALAGTTAALLVATLAGLAPAFGLLVLPLLAALFAWQAAWSYVLRRSFAPVWFAPVLGAVVVAWPIATTLPIVLG